MFDRVYYENNKDSEQTHVRDKGRILVYCISVPDQDQNFYAWIRFVKIRILLQQ
jgi:hypothetical protein